MARSSKASEALRARAIPTLQAVQAASEDLAATRYTVQHLPAAELHARPDQPRSEFGQVPLETLAADILERGVINPLTVRPTAAGYEIVAGERRYRASLLAGQRNPSRLRVPCIVRHLSDPEALWLSVAENLQRENLNPYESARSILRLYALRRGLDDEQATSRLHAAYNRPQEHPQEVAALEEVLRLMKAREGGVNWRSYVRNALPLLQYPEPLRRALSEGLAYTKASQLALIRDPQQLETALQQVQDGHLSVVQTRTLVQSLLAAQARTDAAGSRLQRRTQAWQLVVRQATPSRLKRLSEAQLQEFDALTDRLNRLLRS